MATVAALSTLQTRHCFGVAGRLRDGLAFLEDGVAVYPSGHAIVVYQADTKLQRFVQGSPESQGIVAFAVCPAKRLLALAERGDKATVTIFDLHTFKRRKVLSSSDGCKEFVSVSFSTDGKYVAAQGGAPEWTLSLWMWEKSKLLASVRTVMHPGHTVHQCLIKPGDETHLLSVVGEGTCRMFRIEAGNSLKPVPSVLSKREGQNYAAHAWLVDNAAAEAEALVVGTAAGEVLVAQDGDIKQTLQLEGSAGVASLVACGKGFVVGTTTGSLAVYERDGDGKPYRLARTFEIEPAAIPPSGLTAATSVGRVTSLAVSPSDSSLGCLTADNQLLLLAPSSGDKTSMFSSLQPLAPGFHMGEVTGLATCVRRPIVATCGQDKTIRLWNYLDRTSELVKAFDEEVYSLALHPSGYTLLAAFADKLRLMTVLAEDLRLVRELPIKASRECCFSTGGQYFAAVNNNAVHVYATYTCTPLAVLRGHNGRVRSLWWCADDTALLTAGADGAVYEWRVRDGQRERDFVQKGWTYTSAVGAGAGTGGSSGGSQPSDGNSAGRPPAVFVAAADRKLRQLEDGVGGSSGLQVAKEVDSGAILTQLLSPSAAGGRLLFAATDDGAVRSYALPLSAEFQAVRCSGGPVTRLAMSHDEALLFAATAEGSLFVFDVKDRDPSRILSRKDADASSFAEEVLVGRSDIDEKRQRMAELEIQVAEVTAQNEYQLKLRDLALNERVRELTEKAAIEAVAAKQRYDALLQARASMEVAYEERLRGSEQRHDVQVEALDGQYQQKLIAEMERYQDLLNEKEAERAKCDAQTAALVEQHARVVAEVRTSYERRLEAETAAQAALVAGREAAEREWHEVRRQLEDDVDREVETLKDRSQKQLSGEREANLRLQGENGILKKRFEDQARAMEAHKLAIKAAEAEKKELQEVIESLERDIAALQKNVAGRDEAIAEKEKRILDLKLKTQELEKFRFVLDYKIGELRAQLDPKDMQLADMKALVQGLEDQVETLNRGRAEGELAASQARQREGVLQRDLAKQRAAAEEAARGLRRVQRDIHEVAQLIQEPDKLKAGVVRLYQAHAAAEQGRHARSPAAVASASVEQAGAGEEHSTSGQLTALQQSVQRLRQQLEQAKKSAASTERRLVHENSVLVGTIAELKRELKALQRPSDGRSSSLGHGSIKALSRGVSSSTPVSLARGSVATET